MKYKYSKRSIAVICAFVFGAVASFDAQLASRDSAIQAQAQEIQGLLDQLNKKQGRGGSAAVAPAADSRQLEAQRKEIKEKETKIKQLQQKLDQQNKQLQKLQSAQPTSSDNSKYEGQIASLKKQIAQQEKQISQLKAAAGTSANCDQVRQSYEGRVSELNGQIKNYKSQIADLRDQIKSLKSDVAACQKKQASQKSGSSEDAEALKSLRAELTQATVQLNECRKLNTQYQKDVKQAQDTLMILKSIMSTLGAENDKSDLTAENTQLKQSVAQCEESRKALQTNINNLEQRVASLTASVESLTTENVKLKHESEKQIATNDAQVVAQLQQQVAAQQQQIAQLQEQLQTKQKALDEANNQLMNTTQQTSTSKGTLEKKLADLQALCNEYVAEIERLRAENAQLKQENAELKEKMGESGDLIAENERLQQKVKQASILVTSDVIATPGKSVKTGNIVSPTNKASKTTVVRIDCRLQDNNVIDPGSITIYARIANAANRVVCNGAMENYSFDLNGTQMQYTTKQDIEFTGYGRNLTMLWRRAEATEMPAGLYWVTLYANGYEIGKTSFKLD